ncbi:DUF6153 family protein [Streptomyces sp. NPDC026672]|uniref:DUF6153 family protein n=1 Tax=unclassified Streptomyces TaxID=2593676 RepID=UPI0033FA4945
MIRAEQSPGVPSVGRWRGTLVLGLLLGLLGMHALAPGGGAMGAVPHPPAHTAALSAVDDCPDGHCGGDHLRHADATCASAAVGGGPNLPGPAPGPVGAPVPADRAGSPPATTPDGARAPPSLAELQLLRI